MPTLRQYANQADKQRAYRERQKQARAAEQSAKGLPPLPTLPTVPAMLRWKGLIEAARVHIETAKEEMESYVADRSDKWQESEKGAEYQARIETLELTLSELDSFDE